MYHLGDIKTYKTQFYEYCDFLHSHKGKTLGELIDILSCNIINFEFDTRSINLKDKGYLGKLIKLAFFGLSFNENYNFSDNIINIRICNLIKSKKNIISVKERLTLSNIKKLENIISCKSIEELDIYSQIKDSFLFTVLAQTIKTTNDILNLKFMGIYRINFDYFDRKTINTFQNDLNSIKHVINDKTFTSVGQKYLHIHKRGNKGTSARAIGLKNTFILQIIKKDLLKEKYKYSYHKKHKDKFNILLDENKLNVSE